jgi:hypothetical protein
VDKNKKKKVTSDYEYYQEITMDGLKDIKPEKKNPKKKEKDTYGYCGAVKLYGDIAIPKFETQTQALTEKQANVFITHQAKKRLGLKSSAGGVTLCSKVVKLS